MTTLERGQGLPSSYSKEKGEIQSQTQKFAHATGKETLKKQGEAMPKLRKLAIGEATKKNWRRPQNGG